MSRANRKRIARARRWLARQPAGLVVVDEMRIVSPAVQRLIARMYAQQTGTA